MKLPPRRVLRSIVRDAISDREEMLDALNHYSSKEGPGAAGETQGFIDSYESLMTRLSDVAPPLSNEDVRLLVQACMHARIWRASYLDAWKGTGEGAIILKARQDVERIDRTEAALGVKTPFIIGGADPDGVTTVDVFTLMARARAMQA